MVNSEEEQDALLPVPESNHPSTTSNKSAPPTPTAEQLPQRLSWKEKRLVIGLLISFLLIATATYMLEIPQTKVLIYLVCRDYYKEDLDPDGVQCKNSYIQSTVASLNGWQVSFQAIPGLLTTMIYGSLADKYGRKPILILSLVGITGQFIWTVFILYFYLLNVIHNLKLIWFAPVFALVGGGYQVLASMIFTMLTDAIRQPTRTNVLYWISATGSLSNIVSPLLGTWLMSIDIRLPYIVSGFLLLLAFPFFFSLPETLQESEPSPSSPDETEPLLSSSCSSSETVHEPEEQAAPPPLPRQRLAKFLANLGFKSIYNNFKPLLIRNLLLCFAIISLEFLASPVDTLIPQYAANKFNMELSKTGILASINMLGKLVVTAVVLPILTAYLTRKRNVPALMLDLNVVKSCLTLSSIGTFCIWIASSTEFLIFGILIESFGKSYNPALMSIATSFVDKKHTALMFTTWTFLNGVALFVGTPIMTAIFNAGLKAPGQVWTGLCYLVGSGFMALALALACGVRLEKLSH